MARRPRRVMDQLTARKSASISSSTSASCPRVSSLNYSCSAAISPIVSPMATFLQPPPAAPRRKPTLLPPTTVLENGDRLPVAEFMRRYRAAPSLRKVQLIEGTVHMPSPVNASFHAEPDGEFRQKNEKSGKLTSSLLPGLTLDVKALIKLDKAKVVKGLAP